MGRGNRRSGDTLVEVDRDRNRFRAPRWQSRAPKQAGALAGCGCHGHQACPPGVTPMLGGQLGGVRVPNQLHRQSRRAPRSPRGGILCYTAEAPCPGAIFHHGTRLIEVGTRFAAPPEAHPERRHRNDGDDIAWRIEPSQLELVRTLSHRPRRSLWAGGPSDNS